MLLRAINSSFEGGAGFSAIMGANNAASLSFKATRLFEDEESLPS